MNEHSITGYLWEGFKLIVTLFSPVIALIALVRVSSRDSQITLYNYIDKGTATNASEIKALEAKMVQANHDLRGEAARLIAEVKLDLRTLEREAVRRADMEKFETAVTARFDRLDDKLDTLFKAK